MFFAPFVSVAANNLPDGQTLYITQPGGLDLGRNQHHNGCVRVDDDTCQIDFFVVPYIDYLWLDLDDKVTVKKGMVKSKTILPNTIYLM